MSSTALHPSSPAAVATAQEAGLAQGRAAPGLLLIACLLVLVTCGAYVMAGPQAAMPAGASSLDAARAATAGAGGWMLLACWAGIPGDALLTVASLMLAQRAAAPGLRAGWIMVALVGAVFLGVDTMVGQVLPPLAAATQAEGAYLAARTLFDALFHMGTFIGGVGALMVAWSSVQRPRVWGTWLGGSGLLAVLAGAAGLLGWGWWLATGAAVTMMVAALAGWGWAGFRSAH
ncbi:hypothetical protein AACH06_25090 [Ideonella sp. DXS29W]|uniref:DUF4386 family protein n=1 Tax=Ideonella lacteola TaxID=2984193 RepID=A0ABU9BWI4_9BURK